METKFCGGCSLDVPMSAWNKNKTKKDGLATQCRDCMQKYRKENKTRLDKQRRDYYWKDPEKYKESAAKAWREYVRDGRYGLPAGSIANMLVFQNFSCANIACSSKITWETSHLDHCHKSGRVRGLLCKKCNWALGYVNDDPSILSGLIDYLEEV